MSILNIRGETKLIKAEVRKFLAAEVDPIADDIERERRIPEQILAKTKQMGLFNLTVPEEYGGPGLTMTDLCVVLEEMGRSCASLAMMVAVNNCHVAQSILRSRSDGLMKRYLGRLSKGDIAGYVPLSNIEVSGRTLHIEHADGGSFIWGQADVVLSCVNAGFIAVPVVAGDGLFLCFVEKDHSCGVANNGQIMGLRAAGITGVDLQKTKVLESDRLAGAAVQHGCEAGRIAYAAIAVGLIEACLQASLKYSGERIQFGRAIREFPMVRQMLAEIKIGAEKNRPLVYEAASRYDSGEEFLMAGRVACLSACEDAVSSALKAIQIHGGYGYTSDYPVERYFRDAKSVQMLGEPPVDLKSRIAEEIIL